ncbi:intraflagellar transport protein 81 like protein [Ditylenchus destructor]|uniref:Intraflagellar transport protein 81 like protein n=1 Tax=Ditylenchus destructor TaxID=166010 RepID=A0AAD4N645_9BILA|nr:intraflagellar transport protein 81 like protein [Ditylenchus destructor]
MTQSAKSLRTILDGLNNAPFNRNLSLVKLDSMGGEVLLQTLSDVIGWIFQSPTQRSTQSQIDGLTSFSIDIRSETPDETALRIMNALRILRYPPPRDMDQIHRWRLDILEGNKATIHSILEWIFENVDRLKERVYLASYLTKVEVPPEAQSPEVIRVQNMVEEKVHEFKAVHGRIVESRTDFVRAEDVHSDLRQMADEKEQLLRRIERCKRKVARRPDLDRYLLLAAKLRAENEKHQDLQIQRQEQRTALVHAGQRLSRLEKALRDLERERETADPSALLAKLKAEMEVNQYMLNEKVLHDIATQKKNIEVVQKILAMKSVNRDDITKLKEKIDKLNNEIMEISMQRDKKDEASEDKLVVYRHQSTNIQRKKTNIADSLHTTKQELDSVEAMLEAKKKELSEKTGKDEVISTVQYKLYVKKLRNKSNIYKKKKSELEQAKAEVQILERTAEVLGNRFDEIKQENRSEGRGVMESIEDVSGADPRTQMRPTTAKPTSTDVAGLKAAAEELNEQINDRRSAIQRLNQQIEDFYKAHKEENEQFYAKQTELEGSKRKLEEEQKQAQQEVADIETKLSRMTEELKKNRELAAKQAWFKTHIESEHKAETACISMEKQNSECLKMINQLNGELFRESGREDSSEQIAMWQGLILIFERKIKLCQGRMPNQR